MFEVFYVNSKKMSFLVSSVKLSVYKNEDFYK